MCDKTKRILFEYNRLENDSRRKMERGDEETYQQWMDEAIEAETNMIRCYINQYIDMDHLPKLMQEILLDHEYTPKEILSMEEELKGTIQG